MCYSKTNGIKQNKKVADKIDATLSEQVLEMKTTS